MFSHLGSGKVSRRYVQPLRVWEAITVVLSETHDSAPPSFCPPRPVDTRMHATPGSALFRAFAFRKQSNKGWVETPRCRFEFNMRHPHLDTHGVPKHTFHPTTAGWNLWKSNEGLVTATVFPRVIRSMWFIFKD